MKKKGSVLEEGPSEEANLLESAAVCDICVAFPVALLLFYAILRIGADIRLDTCAFERGPALKR